MVRFSYNSLVDFVEVGQESYSSFLICNDEYWCAVFILLYRCQYSDLYDMGEFLSESLFVNVWDRVVYTT